MKQTPKPAAAHFLPLLGVMAFAVFFLCFKPIIALTQYPAMDDQSYVKMTADFLRLTYPNVPTHSYPPGVLLAWLPAGLMALVGGWLLGISDVVALPMFVGVLSYAYWCGSLLLLASMTRLTAVESLIALLGVPVLYYATHRTTMVHAPEIFFALLTAGYVLKKQPLMALASALVVFALRLNDVPVLLFALAPAIEAHRSSVKGRRLVLAGGALFLVAAIAYVIWLGFYVGYNHYHLGRLFSAFSLTRIPAVLFGGDWGLVWTAPGWVLCLVAGTAWWKRLTLAARLGLAWMVCEFIVCVMWPGNGSDFGYRYLIGSYAGALVVAWDVFRLDTRGRWKTVIRAAWAAGAVWMTWVTWIYKEQPGVTPYFTADGVWTHPELMRNSFEALFSGASYVLALSHSSLGAIYHTIQEPLSPFALPGGTAGSRFQVTVGVGVLLFGLAVWQRVRYRRNNSPL